MVPDNFKHAVVQPLIKKPGLDPAALAKISTISEKIVHCQLMAFLNNLGILEVFQSGFKSLAMGS